MRARMPSGSSAQVRPRTRTCPGGGRLEPLEDLHGGGLPRPVRPEQPEAGRRCGTVEVEAVHGDQVAEALHQLLHLDRQARHGTAPVTQRRRLEATCRPDWRPLRCKGCARSFPHAVRCVRARAQCPGLPGGSRGLAVARQLPRWEQISAGSSRRSRASLRASTLRGVRRVGSSRPPAARPRRWPATPQRRSRRPARRSPRRRNAPWPPSWLASRRRPRPESSGWRR